MSLENITKKDIKTAYHKLKSLAYYDNNDLFLKAKIASFESGSETNLNYLDEQLDNIFATLTNMNESKKENYWNEIIDKIDFYVLPKQVKPFSEYRNENKNSENVIENIFTNNRDIGKDEKYEIDNVIFFIDAPIEIHILSILWIMKIGYILDLELDSKCYGNRLILENSKSKLDIKIPTEDEGLFKPYYNQYQKWRDEGINVAKDHLSKKEDILFINLDIKNYYYSVRIKPEELNDKLKFSINNTLNLLNELFWKVHFKYTSIIKKTGYPDDSVKKIKSDEIILPIGLHSSYILANWYLIDFDKRVNEIINPVYYSRYVDDIFIVLANIDPSYIVKEKCEEILNLQPNYKNFSINEKYLFNILYPIIKLEFDKDTKEYWFKISCYDNLFIQPQKTLVYFFEHDSSLALLDKFINELEKRSSEFRFLPDSELEKNGFDDEAFELIFEDSFYKIKSLKDYKENRYGISSYLSKKIYFSLRNGIKGSKEDANKMLKFFRGTTNLEFFRQWERLLTYFIINDHKTEYKLFIERTINQLNKIELSKKVNGKSELSNKIEKHLKNYLIICFEITLALNPSFLDSEKEWFYIFNNLKIHGLEGIKNWKKFRISNMIRHNYIKIPLLNYTNINFDLSLLENNFNEMNGIKGITFDKKYFKYSPRKVRFSEMAWMVIIIRLYNGEWNSIYSNNYLDESFEKYYEINYWYKRSNDFKDKLKNEIYEFNDCTSYKQNNKINLKTQEISVNQTSILTKLNIGLANIKVEKSNSESSMLGNPTIYGRYSELAKVLNLAEEERCDMIVLPEVCVPHGLVNEIIDNSWKKQRCITTGIEHWNINDVVFNFILTVLPCEIRNVNDAVPILRLKNHYSPEEDFWIKDYEYKVPIPEPFGYHLFRWRGLYFSTYYCYELVDIEHRAIFRSKIDFLLASEWNKDVNYFSNITEATSRDLHCYFIQVNTSDYGDSRITKPSKTEMKDSLRIKGGKNITLLTDEIDIKKLRIFQFKGYGQQKDDKEFKPTPANYSRNNVKVRINNKSFRKK